MTFVLKGSVFLKFQEGAFVSMFFATQFINTALLPLAASAWIPALAAKLGNTIFSHGYRDITSEW